MLVNSKQILLEAKERGFAVPSTNFIDLESARAYVETAEESGLPLILSFAQSHQNIMSLEEAAVIGGYFAKRASVPVILHLDHGEDFDYIKRAIELGFKSVMIDASQESFEDNVALTKQVVAFAHQFDVTVEAELGHVGANDHSESDQLTDSIYTEVSDVVKFVEATGVDSLAVSIGTAHGVYKGEPKLSFERLEEINAMTSIPLVLHGGSSTGDANLKRCATSGIAKINIYSDFINGAYTAIQEEAPADYVVMKAVAGDRMRAVLTHYFDVFETKAVKVVGMEEKGE
ncbi:class II fructose-bisphosphate aldolase [Fundicoccus sp. Sow4_F4]|uniref:class II fructose-bisphosphate aldolase n=1 Tax=Fundicoccus sp. Sow4_F4 TaxID=3438783 RepID=UPI003F909B74